MKILPVGAQFIYADGRTDRQTDMRKLPEAFHSFARSVNTTVASFIRKFHNSMQWSFLNHHLQ